MSETALSADGHAIALLCSTLALPADTKIKPLTPTEWSSLASAVHRSTLQRPGALLGLETDVLERELEISADGAHRLTELLARGGQLALELERLAGRGIWVVTRADETYPSLLKERLKQAAPPLLFGAGRPTLLLERAIAVVGSREADANSLSFTALLSRRSVESGLAVVSGAARGVDTTAMLAAVEAGGNAIGFVADALEKMVRRQDLREHLVDGNLALASTYHPAARFTVGNAMRRNRLIYCLADAAVVVAASSDNGGTRSGALENLKAGWTPLLVRADEDAPSGNRDLLAGGGQPVRREDLEHWQSVEALIDRATNLARSERSFDDLSQNDPDQASSDSQAGSGDLFPLIWPRLAILLDVPRSEADIAASLSIETTQARAWLKRAVVEGLVDRSERPVRYRIATAELGRLFQDSDA